MKKIIHIRDHCNWADMSEEKFLNQKFSYNQEWWDRLLAKIMPQIKWWNRLCSVSYFEYRQQLENIARNNIKKTNADIILEGTKCFPLEEDCIFMSIDDDDWFAPNIFEVLQSSIKKDTDMIVWQNRVVDRFGSSTVRSQDKIYTNNYAFTRKGIQKLSHGSDPVINQKGEAEANCVFQPAFWIEEKINKENFTKTIINDELSATNRTLASATTLMLFPHKHMFFEQLIAMKNYLCDTEIWKNETDQIMNLNKSCYIKIKHD